MPKQQKLSPEEKVKIIHAFRVPSRVMRKLVCRLWLNEVSRQ